MILRNKGTGAGGANTNKNGKSFETITDNETNLKGFKKFSLGKGKYDYYFKKSYSEAKVIFVSQNGLKKYMERYYSIEMIRCPDEAYIIKPKKGKKILFILEKKNQNVEGSVDIKLWAGVALKMEYEMVLGEEFIIHYAFCVNTFLKKKFELDSKPKCKFSILSKILEKNNIKVFYGNDEDYFEKLNGYIEHLRIGLKNQSEED